jgi:hypothetical protein
LSQGVVDMSFDIANARCENGRAEAGVGSALSLGCTLVASLVFVPALLVAMAQMRVQGPERTRTGRFSQFSQEMRSIRGD